MKRTLGVCYYPKQWDKSFWEEDAKAMSYLGIIWVKINKFSWSQLEPCPGELNFQWLDNIALKRVILSALKNAKIEFV